MANEIRKTSLGMQAVGVGPIAAVETREAPREGDFHALGLGVTITVHAIAIGLVFVSNVFGRSSSHKVEEPYQAIEAGLAIKRKSTDAKKSSLPPKEQPPVVKPPDQPGIARDPNVIPPPPDKKPKKPEPTTEDVFNKFRRMDTKSTDEQEVEGSDDGSEYGTLEKAKGDPYVGELIGRMIVDFVVPSVVADDNLVTWGCVKLDGDGKVVDRGIDPDHKSRSHAFNSAVERRLQQTTDMDKPVPNYLKPMLVGKFVCATYTSKRE